MASVTLAIGGRSYQIGCQDGEEPRLLQLAEMVDEKVREAIAVLGANTTEIRQLLFASLLLADALSEQQQAKAAPRSGMIDPAELEPLAERLERLADALER